MPNSDTEIELLRKEIQRLRKELAAAQKDIAHIRKEVVETQTHLGKAYDLIATESENTTDHMSKIYHLVASLNVYIMPLVAKVFPAFVADKRRIDQLAKRYQSSTDIENPG